MKQIKKTAKMFNNKWQASVVVVLWNILVSPVTYPGQGSYLKTFHWNIIFKETS